MSRGATAQAVGQPGTGAPFQMAPEATPASKQATSEDVNANQAQNNGDSGAVTLVVEEEAQQPDSPQIIVECESSAESSRKLEDNQAIILQDSPEQNTSVLAPKKQENLSLIIGQDAQNTNTEIPKIEEYDQNVDANNEEGDVVPEMLLVSDVENKDSVMHSLSFRKEKYRRSQKQMTKTSLLKSIEKCHELGALQRQNSFQEIQLVAKQRPTSRSVHTNTQQRRNTASHKKSEKVTTSFASSMPSSLYKRMNTTELQYLTSLQYQATHLQEPMKDFRNFLS